MRHPQEPLFHKMPLNLGPGELNFFSRGVRTFSGRLELAFGELNPTPPKTSPVNPSMVGGLIRLDHEWCSVYFDFVVNVEQVCANVINIEHCIYGERSVMIFDLSVWLLMSGLVRKSFDLLCV